MAVPLDDTTAPERWIDDLRASKAELDRGERVPMQPVLDRMQAAINRINARKPDADRQA